jgi:hypothetical protein
VARRLASITEASQAGAAPAPVGRRGPVDNADSPSVHAFRFSSALRTEHTHPPPYERMVVFPFALNEETTLTLLCGVVFVHRKLWWDYPSGARAHHSDRA